MSVGTSVFFAGAEISTLTKALLDNGVRNILYSYFYILLMRREAFIDQIMEEYPEVNWFLDSGAYTYAMMYQSKPENLPPIKQFVRRYLNYVEDVGHMYCRVAEPDMDELVSQEQIADWREEMFDRFPDHNVTPVWHTNRGIDAWEDYCKDPRVKTLAIGSGDIYARGLGATRQMVMRAAEYGKPVHGFGCTRVNNVLRVIPFDSVDSSVGGESLVWTRDHSGVSVQTIKSLYSKYGDKDLEGVETQTVIKRDGQYVVDWAPLRRVVRHVVTKPFCRVRLETGRSLRVTTDHSLFRMTSDDELEEVKPSDLKKGDWIATVRSPVWGGKGREVYATRFGVVALDAIMLRYLGDWLGVGPLKLYPFLAIKNRLTQRGCALDDVGVMRVLRDLDMLGRSNNKKLPHWFWDLTEEQAIIFLESFRTSTGAYEFSRRDLFLKMGEALPALYGRPVNMHVSTENRQRRFVGSISLLPEEKNHAVLQEIVRSVEVLPLKLDRDVYDLSVPGSEKFLANGVLAHNTTWAMGQKMGSMFIFKNNRFSLISLDQKAQRRLHRTYFKNIGCDPELIFKDDVGEVRKANIIAWRGVADRLEFMKTMNSRQQRGVNNSIYTPEMCNDYKIGEREDPPKHPIEREGISFMPQERESAVPVTAHVRDGGITFVPQERTDGPKAPKRRKGSPSGDF